MGCHCPHWCTRQFWAFIFTLITIVFLIVAIAAPWYAIGITDVPTSASATKSSVSYLFWWKGVYETITPDKGDSSSETYDWDKLSSDKAKDTYMAAVSLSILGLVFSVVLALLLLFGLVIRATREGFERIFCGFTKWIAAGLALFVLILIIVSWALFISFPSALSDSKFCPQQTFLILFAKNDDLWCSTFAGSEKYDLQPILDQTVNVGWLPFVGWAFAVIATLWALIAFILTVVVRRHGDYEHISTF